VADKGSEARVIVLGHQTLLVISYGIRKYVGPTNFNNTLPRGELGSGDDWTSYGEETEIR